MSNLLAFASSTIAAAASVTTCRSTHDQHTRYATGLLVAASISAILAAPLALDILTTTPTGSRLYLLAATGSSVVVAYLLRTWTLHSIDPPTARHRTRVHTALLSALIPALAALAFTLPADNASLAPGDHRLLALSLLTTGYLATVTIAVIIDLKPHSESPHLRPLMRHGLRLIGAGFTLGVLCGLWHLAHHGLATLDHPLLPSTAVHGTGGILATLTVLTIASGFALSTWGGASFGLLATLIARRYHRQLTRLHDQLATPAQREHAASYRPAPQHAAWEDLFNAVLDVRTAQHDLRRYLDPHLSDILRTTALAHHRPARAWILIEAAECTAALDARAHGKPASATAGHTTGLSPHLAADVTAEAHHLSQIYRALRRRSAARLLSTAAALSTRSPGEH